MSGSTTRKRPPSVRYDLFVPPYQRDPDKPGPYRVFVFTRDGNLDISTPFERLGAAVSYSQGYKYDHVWIIRLSQPLSDTQLDLLDWGENPEMEPQYVESYLRNLGLNIIWKATPRNKKISLMKAPDTHT